MGRYKRYLMNQDEDVPRSSKFYRQHNGLLEDRLPIDLQLNHNADGQRCEMAFPDNLVGNHLDYVHMDGEDAGNQEVPEVPDEELDGSNHAEDTINEEDNDHHGVYQEVNDDRYLNQEAEDIDVEFLFENAQNAENDNNVLYPGAHITRRQSEALILSYVTRYRLSELALRDLLLLINAHTPDVVHQSKYHFLKDLNLEKSVIKVFYCEICKEKVPEFDAANFTKCSNELCRRFGDSQSKASLLKNGCYFLHMPLGPQLLTLLDNPEVNSKLRQDNNKSDIMSGGLYKGLVASNKIGPNNITIQWNTDGASASDSSNCSIWPIQVAVNELPFRDRKDNILLTGLWQGTKPVMDTFLEPFVKELQDLHTNGITLTNGTNVRVHCLIASVDSVARPVLQNIKQYNGSHGCSFCLIPGERIARGEGTSRVYCGDVGELRDGDQHYFDTVQATETGTCVRGVKGPSQLMLIPLFNIISSFVPDYMHNVLLGIVRWYMFQWFDSKNSTNDWYLGSRQKLQIFESRLTDIKPPSEITRVPRSFSRNKKLWKASEFRSFLLYYSLPCLNGLLPTRYLKHWMLLVYAMTIYLREKISNTELELAKFSLRKFILETEALYGKEWMTYNMHTLLHVPQAIEHWGAAWASSTFMFEHFNGVLLNLFSGTQHISSQIFRNYARVKRMNMIINSGPNENWHPSVKTLLKNLGGKYLSLRATRCERLVIFGAGKNVDLTVFVQIAIESFLEGHLDGDIDFTRTRCYQRFLINGILVNTRCYARMQYRKNDVVLLADGNFFEVIHLVDLCFPNHLYRYLVIGQTLTTLDSSLCVNGQLKSNNFVREIREPYVTREVVAIDPKTIVCKCVRVSIGDTLFLCKLVNNLERD